MKITALFLCLLLPGLAYTQFSPVESQGVPPRNAQKKREALKLFEQTGVPSQFAEIDPAKGAELVGPKGTIFRIPPNAFQQAGGAPVTGPVRFEYKDLAGAGDVLLSNLATQSAGKPIASGGVVYMDATAAGKPLSLAPGKTIELEFPEARTTPAMQGFSGKYDPDGSMNWTPMLESLTINAANGVFADSIHTVQGYLYSLVSRYTSCAGTQEFQVEVSYDLKTGMTMGVRVIGFSSCYSHSIPEILQHVKWRGNSATPGKTKFTVAFSFDRTESAATPGTIPPDPQFSCYDPAYTRASDRIGQEKLSRTLQVTGLGWVNWDEFITPPEKQDFLVKLKGGPETEFAKVFVVYDFKTIVLDARQVSANAYRFSGAPTGIAGTLIGLSYLDGKPYLGVLETQISGSEMALSLNPTTVEELKAKVRSYVD